MSSQTLSAVAANVPAPVEMPAPVKARTWRAWEIISSADKWGKKAMKQICKWGKLREIELFHTISYYFPDFPMGNSSRTSLLQMLTATSKPIEIMAGFSSQPWSWEPTEDEVNHRRPPVIEQSHGSHGPLSLFTDEKFGLSLAMLKKHERTLVTKG